MTTTGTSSSHLNGQLAEWAYNMWYVTSSPRLYAVTIDVIPTHKLCQVD